MSAVSIIGSRRRHREISEREKMARLEAAEELVADLNARVNTAVSYLEERRQRNHWRETIERIISRKE